MACSKPIIPLEEVLVAWSRARDFEKANASIYFHLEEDFWFIPKHSTGSDARYPTLAIARYAKTHHGVVIGKEEDFAAPVDTAPEDDEVFQAPVVNLVEERTVLESLINIEARMRSLAEAQTRRMREIVTASEKRTAIRIANSRSATAEEVAAAEHNVLQEIRYGRGTTVYEVKSRLDTGSPLAVVGSDVLRRELCRTSDYGSTSSSGSARASEIINTGRASDFVNTSSSGGASGTADDLLEAYREATREVKELEAGVQGSLQVLSTRARMATKKEDKK